MSRMRSSLLMAVILGVMAASPLSAQTVPSPYRHLENRQSLTFFGGQLFTDKGKLGLGPSSKQAAGVRYSIRLGGPFSAEASGTYLPSTRAVFDTALVAGGGLRSVGTADLDLALVTASLRFDLTGPRTYHGFQPYILIGGGATIDLSGSSAVDSQVAPKARFNFGTRFAGQVGAGVEWFATRRVALRLDARDVFWRLRIPEAFVGDGVANTEWVQNLGVSLGVVYHF